MHRGHKVVCWVPFGRELTVSVLLPYLLREHAKGTVDEIWLCMNTDPDQASDRLYANAVAGAYRGIVHIKPCPGPDTPDMDVPNVTSHQWFGASGNVIGNWRDAYEPVKQRNTGRFPLYMTDRNTIYIRFDDDIVWVHPDTIPTLVDRVLGRRTDTLAVFPVIFNNAVSSWLLQKYGRIPMDWGEVGRGTQSSEQVSAVDQVGWGDPYFAEKLHYLVLDHLEAGDEEGLLLGAELTLGRRQQASVSCFAIHGDEYADLNGILSWAEEEHWLTMHRTGEIGKSNIICGMAQVAHFSFMTQREYLLHRTTCLDRYRTLSEKVTASL